MVVGIVGSTAGDGMISDDVLVIVQARMGSTRYPGKSLAPLCGRPALAHLLDSLRQCVPIEGIVVATSVQPADNPIARFAEAVGVGLVRGSESNVASRFAEAIHRWGPRWIARVSGDSPLFDYRILERAAELAVSDREIVSTVVSGEFPAGMNAEVVPAALYVAAYGSFRSAGDLEHVTKFFYEHRTEFRFVPVPGGVVEAQRYHFAFDTRDDGERLDRLMTALGAPHWTHDLLAKCRAYDRLFGS